MTQQEDQFKQERFAAKAALHQMYAEKWIDISLDTDRQLLTLSTAAIGLLATFITSKGVTATWQLLLFSLAIGSFILVIAAILFIFKLNRAYIATQSEGKTPEESLMQFLDKSVRFLFFLGIFSTAICGLAIASNDLDKTLNTNTGAKSDQGKPARDSISQEHSPGHDSRQREPGRNEQPNENPGSPAKSSRSNNSDNPKQL